MAVKYDSDDKVFTLLTRRSMYQMKISAIGALTHLYYGKKVPDRDLSSFFVNIGRGFSGSPSEAGKRDYLSYDTLPMEYPAFGAGDYRTPALVTGLSNGSTTCELHYVSHSISRGKYSLQDLPAVRGTEAEAQTLRIVLFDKVSGLEVHLLYGVFEERDVITRSVLLFNRSGERMEIHKVCSASMDFQHGDFDLIHFHGRHTMERIPERLPVSHANLRVSSFRGMSSHQENPFVILCDRNTDEDHGICYGVMLMYSGNHCEEASMDQTGSVRIMAGIASEGFRWILDPGESFTAPDCILSWSDQGLNGLSQQYHSLIKKNVLPPKFQHVAAPIVLNSWEAMFMDFNEERFISFIHDAKDLGVDMVVLDDGWFGERNDDTKGLGDWVVNRNKLPGGLEALSDCAHDNGMRFGLWIEPEMINENSRLYREHPDWALKDPGRNPVLSRNQLVLDMSRREVTDYLFASLTAILDRVKIDYIKWDFNRCLANVYSAKLDHSHQGEVSHRFVLGTYHLLESLTDRYPDLFIEGCAGGGGRFDAGMLYYEPQIWCSDNTDPMARLKIQWGTSYGYPISTISSHVSVSPNLETGRTAPLETRFESALFGSFGYELDPACLSDEEKEKIRRQNAVVRKEMSLIREGTFFRLRENRICTAWMFVSPDRGEAMVKLILSEAEANPVLHCVCLRGLREDVFYEIKETGDVFSGAVLMSAGYTFPPKKGDYPAYSLHLSACSN